MQRRNRRNSGQVLIIVSLTVTLLLLSTALFVAESLRSELVNQPSSTQTFSFYEQGLRNTMISALANVSLANVSNSGDTGVLLEDLDQFGAVAANYSYNSILQITATPLNATPYQDGIWINWSSNGEGVTSACVNYSLDSYDTASTYHSEGSINITTEIDVSGYYALEAGSTKQVNLTCNVNNEGKPALANNFTIYYQKLSGRWVQVSSPNNIVDYGNGTYTMSFTISTYNPSAVISVNCYDLRGIFVQANMTCTEVT